MHSNQQFSQSHSPAVTTWVSTNTNSIYSAEDSNSSFSAISYFFFIKLIIKLPDQHFPFQFENRN